MKNSTQPVTKLIIPLAGFGTRFLPSSSAYPKEVTHLVDKPVLQYLIEEAYDSGITEIIFIINSQKGIIKNFLSLSYQRAYMKRAFGKGAKIPEDFLSLLELLKKMKFRFITKDSTFGDGHSVLLARPFIKEGEAFAVTMGDLLSHAKVPFIKQLIAVNAKENTPVISVQKGTDESIPKNGVISIGKTKGRIHEVNGIIEKPSLEQAPSRIIMTGKYVLTPDIFPYLKKLLSDKNGEEVKLANALRDLSKEKKLIACECDGVILDTGNKLDFLKATILLGVEHQAFSKPIKEFIKSLKI